MLDLLPYPNINGENNEKKIEQIKNYLLQLKEAIEFTLGSMSDENKSVADALAKGIADSNAERENQITQKVSNGNVVSEISQSAEAIILSGNRVIIDSDNFKLTKEGNVTANNATLNGSFSTTDGTASGTTTISNGQIINGNPNGVHIGIANAGIGFGVFGLNRVIGGNNFQARMSKSGMHFYLTGINDSEQLVDIYYDGKDDYIMLNRSLFGTNNNVMGSTDFIGDVRVGNGSTLYTPTGTVSVSDRDKKNEISGLDTEKSSEFIYSLKPCKFKYNDGTSNRFHHGFIAQEVKESMGDDDWGAYIDTGENGKGLRYEEIIADLVATVQAQNERIKALEEKL